MASGRSCLVNHLEVTLWTEFRGSDEVDFGQAAQVRVGSVVMKNTSTPFRLGMIGLGTVGTGVLELLDGCRERLERRLGRSLEVVRIAVRDAARVRSIPASIGDPAGLITTSPWEVIEAADLDLVVEVAGGVEGPRDWITAALDQGKDVVTANKAVLALHGEEIFRRASESKRQVYYEASVAAAIPVIEVLQNGLVANDINQLSAILNGTCNFILSHMEGEGFAYDKALQLAQERGFAEADPTLDVSGGDAAHKLALLAGIITGSHVPISNVFMEGIERITAEDFRFAHGLDFTIKMVGTLRRQQDTRWEMRVHPTLISGEDILAKVQDEYNAIALEGDAVGPMIFYGKGAGSHPTASSVVADILRAARGEKESGNPRGLEAPAVFPMDDVKLRHYVRMSVRDHPGVLGRITSFFGDRGISIASMQQPDAKAGAPVPVVFVTHHCRDKIVSDCIRDLESGDLVDGLITRIRIGD